MGRQYLLVPPFPHPLNGVEHETSPLLRIMGLSRWWYFKSRSSGLWQDTNVSEGHTASFFWI